MTSSSPSKIFVDTAIFRYAASIKLVQEAKLKPAVVTSKDGESRRISVLFYDNFVKENRIDDELLKVEVVAIRKIAEAASDGQILLCYSHEVNLELLFQPEVDLVEGRMHGAPCRIVHSPLLKMPPENFSEADKTEYPFSFWGKNCSSTEGDVFEEIKNEFFRLPIGCFAARLNFRSFVIGVRGAHHLKLNASNLLHPYLMLIDDDRYKEILKQLNAGCVGSRRKENLYLDAYHLWCAEKARCQWFLTTEKALLNQFKSKTTIAISPSDLLAILGGRRPE